MSANVRHLLERVVRPALARLGERYATVAAERLVLGTGAVESSYRELLQGDGGPALGFWQMEPATYRDIWANFLAYRPELAAAARSMASAGEAIQSRSPFPDPEELVGNLRFAAAMCRVHYLRDSMPLPEPDDVDGMARLWKRHYNTHLGAGTLHHFRSAWLRLVHPAIYSVRRA